MIINNKTKIKHFLIKVCKSKDVELLNKMLENSTIRKTSNKEIIINEGEVSEYLYLIMSGVYRAYYTTSSSDEVTVVVAGECEGILSTPDMAHPGPNYCTYQTISRGELLEIPFSFAAEILRDYPEVNNVHCKMLSDSMTKQMYLTRIRQEDTLSRVKWINEKHPELITKVQKQYIANMLGMTQSTYSKTLKRYLEAK